MDVSRRTAVTLAGLGTLAAGAVRAQTAPAGPAKLSSNENPWGPGPAARQAIAGAVADGSRYPGAKAAELAAAIAAFEGVAPENIVLGNGSGEILTATAVAFGLGGKEIVAADPTFGQLQAYARSVGGKVRAVPLDSGLSHDLEAMAAAIGPDTALVYVCNPNNPTGTLLDPDRLAAFCETVSARVPVFVDEAYLELAPGFLSTSMTRLVKAGKPVIVARTFSKLHGMAGLRIGYGVGPADLVKRIGAFRMSIQNTLGIAAAKASLGDTAFLDRCRREIALGRERIYATLRAAGLPFTPSHGNFVFFDTKRPAGEFLRALEARGVQIAQRTPTHPTFARVSVGLPEELAAFDRAVKGLG